MILKIINPNFFFSQLIISKLHLLFYKQPVYKQVAHRWQIEQLSELNPFSLSNNKNCRLELFLCNKRKIA